MKRILLTAALLLAGGLGSAALAQDPVATPGPADAEKNRDIERLLRITKAGEVGVHFIDDFLPTIQQMFELQLADLPQAEREKAKRIMEEEVRREFTAEKMIAGLVPVYARNFTAEDVRALISFWESPAGAKFASLQPQIMKEAGEVGQEMGQVVLDRIISRMVSEVKLNPPPRPPAPKRPARRRRN